MDRFSEQESEYQDDVPRNPMSKFVKSAPSQPEGFGKVEIQASRREQRKAAPQAPAVQSQPLGRPTGNAQMPVWAGKPPPGSMLQVYKDGKIIESISLTQAMTVFGRGQASDIILDHQSLSRQHAAICYQRMTSKWLILDLGSLHGTACNGKPVLKNHPMEVKEGCKIQFAASSRVFVFQSTSRHAAAQSARAASGTREPASDLQEPRDFGPKPSSSPGRFADLIEQKVVEQTTSVRKQSKRASDVTKRPAVSRPLKTGLYDYLPPPEQTSGRPKD